MDGIVLFLVLALVGLVVLVVIALLLFGGLRTSIMFTVHTQENVIVERFGKFRRVARPGLNFKAPFVDSITKPISLRIQQLEVNIESKTKDNVFVTVPVAVQYVIKEEQVVDAYYRLSNPEAQIRSYVFDTVRSALSGLLGSIIQMGMLGALLTFAGQPLYEPHMTTTLPYGLTPLADQQLAGLLMWVPAALPYLAVALLIAWRQFGTVEPYSGRPR